MPRFTIDVGTNLDDLMKRMAKEQDTTKSEIVRRALNLYAYLQDATNNPETKAQGLKVSISDANDKVIKDVVLP